MILLNTNVKSSRTLTIEDAQQAVSFRTMETPNYRYMVHRLMGLSREEYTDMEYDLSESARIIDTEALVSEAFKKKRQMVLKNEYLFESKSKRNLAYIEKRLAEIEFVTQQTFRDFLSEVVENMVNFNNCFILKYRKEDNSSGKVRTIPSGKEFKPIAGLYVLAAPTIDVATDKKTGSITRYRHRITEQCSRQFKPQDIFHVYENRRTGMTIGTPPLEAVRDDILSLRSIEQYTEDMIRKNASPFIHVKVGNDNQPARLLGDGTSEIDVYSSIIDNMEYSGGVATPHRVEIDYKGSESRAMRLESYLSYFKNRVLNGLSISEADLGGQQNGNGVFESLREDVRAYQATISHFVTNYILTELLLESPYYQGTFYIPQEERVQFTFVEADEDRRIKLESHALNLFVSGLITKEAAIKWTQYDVADLQPDPVIETSTTSINSNNTAKANIGNIVNPQNQHNTTNGSKTMTIKDSLQVPEYFTPDLELFRKNLTASFPMFENFEDFSLDLYNKCTDLAKSFSLKQVNELVEKVIMDIL